MGDSEGTRQLLLEHAVRIDDDGVVVYKVYGEFHYMRREAFFNNALGQRARQGVLFPEVGKGGNECSNDQLRQPSEKYATEEPYGEIQDEPQETPPEAPELTDEEVEEWLEDDDDVLPYNGSRFSGAQTATAGSNSSSKSTPIQHFKSAESEHSRTTDPSTFPQRPPTRPRWPTSSAPRTPSRGSWGKS